MAQLSQEFNRIQAEAMEEVVRLRLELAERDDRIRELEEQAVMDPLTDLVNRRGLEDFFNQEQSRRLRQGSAGATFVIIDLDRFKDINDTYGHGAGDACLQEISRQLRKAVRTLDCTARLGGDEFVVILSHLDPEQAQKKVASLRADLDNLSVQWEGKKIDFGASVGSATIGMFVPFEEVYKMADRDLYRNKAKRHAAVEVAAARAANKPLRLG